MVLLTADPRSINETDFPAHGTSEEQWLFLLNYALLAPSEYNTQPWRFRIIRDQVELSMDPSRRLPVVDPEDREMLISCGAACLNLHLAACHFGYQVWMESSILSEPSEILVRLKLGNKEKATEEDERLFSAIPLRHTNRSAYQKRGIAEKILVRFQHDAGREGTWLQVVQDEQIRQSLTQLIVDGDRELWANKQFRYELAEWVHPQGIESADGLPGSPLSKGSIRNITSPFLVRTFDLWREESSKDSQLAAAAPVLAVLGTFSDTPGDWFAAGRALERVLLDACANGLQTSFVNQPIEVPSLRTQLSQLLEREDFPQLVIRIGYGEPGAVTPRRCVQDVLLATP